MDILPSCSLPGELRVQNLTGPPCQEKHAELVGSVLEPEPGHADGITFAISVWTCFSPQRRTSWCELLKLLLLPYQPRPGQVEEERRMDNFIPAVIVFIFMGFEKADKGWRKWKLDEFDLNRWWRLMPSSSWRRKRLPWKKKLAQAHPVSIILQDVSTTWLESTRFWKGTPCSHLVVI